MIPETKICTKCKVDKLITNFKIVTKKIYSGIYVHPHSWCNDCMKLYQKEKAKEYLIKSPEKARNKNSVWNSKNIEKVKIYNKTYRKNNLQFIKEKRKIDSLMTVHKMPDPYIINLISSSSNLSKDQIINQPELIKLTRTIVQIKRILKAK